MTKQITNKATICIKDDVGIIYHLCNIEHTLKDSGDFEYVFIPNYEVIDLVDKDLFDDIPGLDLSLKKKEYIRRNVVPTFISERVPSENRENLSELLAERGMNYLNPIEYMIKSKKAYSGDDLFVVEYYEKELVSIKLEEIKTNITSCIKKILIELARGNDVSVNSYVLRTEDKNTFKVLYELYKKSFLANKTKQRVGIDKAKSQNKYRGRKAIEIEDIKVLEMKQLVDKKQLSPKKAAMNLGISIDKYYRVLRKLQK